MENYKIEKPFDLNDVVVPKRINFANKPTRILRMKSFSNEITSLSVKCDDETSFLMSGNKIRKLEYVFQEILELKSKKAKDCEVHVFTCGGIQSNHCRATAVLCRRAGFIPHLILRGSEPSLREGNLFINSAIDSEVLWITKEEYSNKRDEIMKKEAKKFENDGKNVTYVIPVGASNALGMWGYVECIHEILKQKGRENFPDHIVVSCGSGGTLAGLIAGIQLFKLKNVKIWGACACDSKKYFMDVMRELYEEFNSKFKAKLVLPGEDKFQILDDYIGKGYAIPYKEEMKLVKKLAVQEGIILDPVYTGKAFYMCNEGMKKGLFKKEGKKSEVMFIHTGGFFGILTKNQISEFFKFNPIKKT